MNRRQQFEQELKAKLEQKRSVHSGAEQVLMKSFKYFDLDNSGAVDLQEFIKTVEKIGVVINSLAEIEDIFKQYDTSGDGLLDYQEFASIIFGNQSATTKQLIQQKPSGQEGFFVEKALESFRSKIAARGARGLIGLQRSFKIMDDDDSKSLDIQEFTKAIKDYRIEVAERDINLLFNAFDVDKNGTLSYDEFLRAVRGPMNAFRKSLVNQAFNKLDRDRSGLIDINDVRGVYNAKDHPDVRAGKKTEDQILQEFLETFELHHNIAGGTQGDHIIDKEEWEEYYNNIGASIDNDQYFELMITNTWKLNETAPVKRGELVGAQSMKEAFGKQPQNLGKSVGGKKQLPQKTQELEKASSVEELLEKFRQRLAARGARGMVGLSRSFKIMDDNNSKALDKNEFIKAIRDYRVDIAQNDLSKIFDAFDRDGSGELSYDEFLRAVRGPMNQFRKNLVQRAFKKLDKDGSGLIDINDIKGVYNAKNHPDVKSGKKTEEDILGDFLETFEMHHNISDKARNDHVVTQEEFEEYYNNVSMSIDDDKYFELMMNNTWKLSGQEEVKKAWAGQVGGKEPAQGRAAWAADHHKKAPYGTTQTPVEYSTSTNPQASTVRPSTKQTKKVGNQGSTEELVEKFRNALLSRGARGIIGLQRSFKIMDDNNNKTLEVSEFSKAIKDFRVDIDENDIQRLFQAFDRDGSGTIDYDELLRQIRGPMNTFRVNLVKKAFQKIDKSGDGVLEISDLKGVYNAKNHPDVKSGKKTEDNILCEFLDTFEMHHALATGGTGRDSRVTFEEWMEYYNNVSCSIDDDRYFELMMNNAWNLDNKAPVQKAWTGEVGSQAATKKKYF